MTVRRHKSAATPASSTTTIVFDGDCGVCNGWVGLLDRADSRRRFDFVPAQSPRGGALLDAARVSRAALDTIVVIDGGRIYLRSDAILHAMSLLGGSWKMTGALRIVPRPLRDLGYRAFARMRYRLFGRADFCRCSLPRRSSLPDAGFPPRSGSTEPFRRRWL